MSLTITTGPSTLAVSLVDAKAHLRVSSSDEDDLITSLIHSARSKAESFLKSVLIETTFSLTLDQFPAEIHLPIGPVLSTTGLSISYVDAVGATQVIDASHYKVSLGPICRIRPAYGETWPATRAEMDAVTVAFKAGYADAGDLPAAIVAAIKMILGDFYEYRENSQTSLTAMPLGARNLLMPFVRHD